MPIYEYYCAGCDLDFEVMRPVTQSGEPANCERCGKPGERQLSNFAFKSNTFTSPKFKASLEKPMRARDRKLAEDSDQRPAG
ncbi:MAG: zinc ribbon domain-containing protein [Chloroflexi bacterium]|nr:zinc ribbon domain-containing protein [Chloroflexota bacterium]MCI0789774.1 zinc ribbon domain-containing protein [Chloroflexota bacterium]MCI0802669.1 zinc ribbon domain-containing protein [Chloroflexota bacterium]MCI0812149.1 zinc ribbon domain-containing protein [Chloroflexota bacterium]MCI0828973.1 zinc ribbon domain-containing protein [Chloroflexota bacterium]